MAEALIQPVGKCRIIALCALLQSSLARIVLDKVRRAPTRLLAWDVALKTRQIQKGIDEVWWPHLSDEFWCPTDKADLQ